MAAIDQVYELVTARGQISNFRYTPRVCKMLDRIVGYVEYTDNEDVPNMARFVEQIDSVIEEMEAEAERLTHLITGGIAREGVEYDLQYSNPMTFCWWTATDAGAKWVQAIMTYDWLCTHIWEARWYKVYDQIEAYDQTLFYNGKLKDIWKRVNKVVELMVHDEDWLAHFAQLEAAEAERAVLESAEDVQDDSVGDTMQGAQGGDPGSFQRSAL